MAKANRKYKDSVFSLYFSDPARLIELYNSVMGTNYPKDTPIEINTLEDVLFKDRVNDVSFMVNNELIVLIEHQSTINQNMPVRLLLYISRLYEKILGAKSIYKSNLIRIPTPRFIVLYNGLEESKEQASLKLSDAFLVPDKEPMLELHVNFHNISYGKSPEIMSKCQCLNEYSTFIYYVREELGKNKSLNEAIPAAIKRAIQNDVMKDFLAQHGSEVENMLFEEWDWEEYASVQREEGLEKGRKEGEEFAQASIIRKLGKSYGAEAIAKMLEMPLSFVQEALELHPAN